VTIALLLLTLALPASASDEGVDFFISSKGPTTIDLASTAPLVLSQHQPNRGTLPWRHCSYSFHSTIVLRLMRSSSSFTMTIPQLLFSTAS